MDWNREISEPIHVNEKKGLSERSCYIDLSQNGKAPLRFGEETFFVNASIMNTHYNPRNAPWLVDLDLPRNMNHDEEEE